MNKQEFLARLREALAGLPQDDVAERMAFYEEMIDDRLEDGLTEEEAVAGIGSVEEIAAQVLEETPITKIVRERVRTGRRLQAWEIILLVLGFPLWFPLLIAAFAIVLSVYVVIWSLILALWAVAVSLIAAAIASLAAGAFYAAQGNMPQGLMMAGAALVVAGMGIFLFFGCKAATKGAAVLTKKIALGIKSLFLRKENEA